MSLVNILVEGDSKIVWFWWLNAIEGHGDTTHYGVRNSFLWMFELTNWEVDRLAQSPSWLASILFNCLELLIRIGFSIFSFQFLIVLTRSMDIQLRKRDMKSITWNPWRTSTSFSSFCLHLCLLKIILFVKNLKWL